MVKNCIVMKEKNIEQYITCPAFYNYCNNSWLVMICHLNFTKKITKHYI